MISISVPGPKCLLFDFVNEQMLLTILVHSRICLVEEWRLNNSASIVLTIYILPIK